MIISTKRLQDLLEKKPFPDDGISRIGGRSVFLYGAGNYAGIIYGILIKNGIPQSNILGFLDRAANVKESLFGHPVLTPDDPSITDCVKSSCIVYISIYTSLSEHEAIGLKLREIGFVNIRTCYEIAVSCYQINDPNSRISTSDFFSRHKSDILAGYDFWEDLDSLETYVNHFAGYISGNVGLFSLETKHKQYCALPPIVQKGHKRSIDCGAFTGDTVRDLFEIFGKAESYALFEPSLANFKILSEYAAVNKDVLADSMFLFPCGVWDTTRCLLFDDKLGSASNVSDNGSVFIQCVAIDDVLHGYDPTFIKMDIEGAEPQALRGAKHTIEKSKPDLAISVYHVLNHFWELPEMIRQWVPEYRFFLRTYGAAGFETILYATVAR